MAESRYINMRNRAGEIVARARVDAVDYERLSAHRWCWDGRYPRRNVGGYSIRMHRELLGLGRGDPRQGDHINGDRLDNRRANLRILPSQAAQVQNVAAHGGGTSKHRGVFFDRARGKWVAIAGRARRQRFDTEAEAARAAALWRRESMPYAVDR